MLGEFTFASLLNYDTLQVAINLQSKSDAQESVAASLASILFAALLLVVLSVVSGGRGRRAPPGGRPGDRRHHRDPGPVAPTDTPLVRGRL